MSIPAASIGFPPIARRDARVLVLGSMPSEASLARRQYYGHSRNAFWPIMGALFAAGPELVYRRRQQIIKARGLAVWDVLQECVRPGSLDADIALDSEVPNDLAGFLAAHRRLRHVFFNGQKAQDAFRRHVLPTLDLEGRTLHFTRLPSTSPAHAGRSFAEKLTAWRAIERALRQGEK